MSSEGFTGFHTQSLRRRLLRLCVSCTAFGGLAVAVSANGQTVGQLSADEGSSQKSSSDVAEVVVTAQRREEKLVAVPATITALSGATLASAGVVNITDLVQVVPGLTFQVNGAFFQPNIRGVTGQSAGASVDGPIAVYVDGIYQQGETGISFDLPDVDRVEVDKGPQGTLYGRNSTGGSIQIFTKGPSFMPTADLSVTGGGYTGAGLSRASSDLGFSSFVTGPIVNDVLAGSVSVSYRHVDGFSNNYDYGRISPLVDSLVGNAPMDILNSFSARGKLLFTPSDKLRITGEAFYIRRSDDGYGMTAYSGLTEVRNFPDGLYSTKPWNYAFDSPYPAITNWNSGGSLGVAYDFEAGTLRSSTTYNSSKYFYYITSSAGYSPDCLAAFVCVNASATLGALSQAVMEEILFTSTNSGRLRYTAGANLYRGHVHQYLAAADFTNGAVPAAPQIVHPPLALLGENIYSSAYAAFVNGDYDLADKWTLSAGVRYSEEKKSGYDTFAPNAPGVFFPDLTEVVFTPRGSIRYAIDPSTNVYATISRGFTSGIYTTQNPTAPPTKPEEITAYEIGLKTSKPNYSFNVAAFYYNYTDMQVTSQILPTVAVTNNAATARMAGLDAEGSYNLTNELLAHLGLSWLPLAKFEDYAQATAIGLPFTAGSILTVYTLDASGARLLRTPKLTVTFNPSYTTAVLNGELSFTPQLYYSSSYNYQVIDNLQQGSYFLLGADLSYRPKGSSLELSLWGKNLTNKAIISSVLVSTPAFAVRYAAPQEIGATVRYRFGG
jgi:iron complex outermembrane recepter protein